MQLSKSLTWLFRYSVESEGLQKDAEGFVKLADVLLHPQFKPYSEQEVRKLIEAKQERFVIKEDENKKNAAIKARPREFDARLNKCLYWTLRHGAERVRVTLLMDEQGYVELSALLKHTKFEGRWTEQDIRQLMEISKGVPRYEIKRDLDSGKDFIRAYHGHSISVPKAYEELKAPSLEEAPAPVAIRSLTVETEKWEDVKEKGLSRCKGKKHEEKAQVWLSPAVPTESPFSDPGKHVLVYVDVIKAMKDGYKFYRAGNNFLGTPGNDEGVLPPKYFEKVVDFKTGEEMEFNRD